MSKNKSWWLWIGYSVAWLSGLGVAVVAGVVHAASDSPGPSPDGVALKCVNEKRPSCNKNVARWVDIDFANRSRYFHHPESFVVKENHPEVGLQAGDILFAKNNRRRSEFEARVYRGIMHFPAFAWHPKWRITPQGANMKVYRGRQFILHVGLKKIPVARYDRDEILRTHTALESQQKILAANPDIPGAYSMDFEDGRHLGLSWVLKADRAWPDGWSSGQKSVLPPVGASNKPSLGKGVDYCEFGFPLRMLAVVNDDGSLRWRSLFLMKTRPPIKREPICILPEAWANQLSELDADYWMIRDEFLVLSVGGNSRDRGGWAVIRVADGSVAATNRHLWISDDAQSFPILQSALQPRPDGPLPSSCWRDADREPAELLDRNFAIGECIFKQFLMTYKSVETQRGK